MKDMENTLIFKIKSIKDTGAKAKDAEKEISLNLTATILLDSGKTINLVDQLSTSVITEVLKKDIIAMEIGLENK